MKLPTKNTLPYSESSFTTVPTRGTTFWRKFIPWQVFRFIVLNLKIMKIVVGGHS
jgi:hypothetical protein